VSERNRRRNEAAVRGSSELSEVNAPTFLAVCTLEARLVGRGIWGQDLVLILRWSGHDTRGVVPNLDVG